MMGTNRDRPPVNAARFRASLVQLRPLRERYALRVTVVLMVAVLTSP
jgi:hypothetical protein